jgi:hypothetical protein
MSFLSPWYLLALLGVVIPLAIHLSHREKAEKVVFSTIRFLNKKPKKMILFQRIQQWLLLLIRAAIIALIAMAFARPFVPAAFFGPERAGPQSVVILLDTSMSMRYKDYFDQAKMTAVELIKSLRAGDEAAVVTFSDGTGHVKELTANLNELAAFVGDLDSPGFQPTRYLPALQLADRLLESAAYKNKTVFLISDYQRTAMENLDTSWRLSSGVALKGIRIGGENPANLAVTDVKSPAQLPRDQDDHVILGRVRNLGTRFLPEARIFLRIGDKTIDTETVDLTNHSEAVVKFTTAFRKYGVHLGALTIGEDPFTPDNTLYFTVSVLQPIRILVVVGESPGKNPTEEITWFKTAVGIQGRSLFQLTVARPEAVTTEVIDPSRVIVVINAANLGSVQRKTLKAWVEKGGSLLLAPAARVDAAAFNRFFYGLAPATLQQKFPDMGNDFLSIADINGRHPLIKSLRLGESADFGTARFRGYWSATPIDGSKVIMGFDNGEVALVEQVVGRGRVLLFTSSLNTEWNNFPLQVLYAPLMQETLRYLALQEEKKRSYTIGDPVPLVVPAGNAIRVTDPRGKETVLTSTTGETVFYRATKIPGFYSIRGGRLQDAFAVNTPREESDLAFRDPAEIIEALVLKDTAPPSFGESAASILHVRIERSQRIWWWILLVVVLLGLAETFLANRTYR